MKLNPCCPLLLCCCVLLVFCSACKRAEQETPAPAATVVEEDKAPVDLSDAGATANLLPAGPKSAGDLAWEKAEEGMQPPAIPEEWQVREPSKEQIATWELSNGKRAGEAAEAARDFYTRFPEHAMAGEAREREYSLLNMAVQLGSTNLLERLEKLEQAQLQDKSIPEEKRFELRMQQLQRKVLASKEQGMPAALAEMEQGIRKLQTEFTNRTELIGLMITLAQGWMDNDGSAKALALAQEILRSNADEEVKASAQELVRRLERVGQPLELKFTAIDGRAVDLEQMRGKVVLVDFWATWCKPCVIELPNVKAAYEKLHGKGFEIIGISFDQEKSALEAFVTAEKMTWPQHFDASEEGNKLGKQFGIQGIPTMWLVDKKGILRHLNAREDLVAKVEKLLAE